MLANRVPNRFQAPGAAPGRMLANRAPNRCQARVALYALRKLYHSKELSPLLSLCRSLSRGSIISLYWSLRRLTHLGSNLPGLLPTRHCDMQRRILRTNSSGFKAEKHAKRWRSIAVPFVPGTG